MTNTAETPANEDDDDWEREPDPSDSLRTFGAMVQALREHAGLSRAEFAEIVRFSKHTVESVERGRRMPDEAYVERGEGATGNTGALREGAKHLTRRDPGLAAWFRQWARLERTAPSLCTYECRLIPGMLQSEGYMRALCENDMPPLTDDALEARVQRRLERQRLLTDRPNTTFDFIIEESVLIRRLGGLEVTRDLFDHILRLSKLRNVTIQIMPANSEHHACLAGPIRLAETPGGKRLAYCEGQESGRLISELKQVAILYQRYARLRSQALSPLESVGLLERIRGAL
ncbi:MULTISPECIES: helix-turn-helix domain-containing protein [Streptomyces]|uniref:XRE family transcriptional regulator n=1 Tax=Streptomyces tsukubensis (strain DSM 42081 / NBRC 108919 / NRRL 18488 / 9993) TaxID=1114943 RepID=I2N9D1_STRT9|nr:MULTISPECIES: helix-turn-helix transcriptional regulator [Streptomyces]AZK97488.1 transcriptional regulator [Streptomyces tsukubensis]EIF93628.1 DNA-binding protein [Streptomyces tsukubensis NRRL18488]MYS68276.1 helix-turn-helix domain-containing protein [Streptomyces sp. SID5473]QKM66564.1 XRE family transcriptional regulator [Streptomyces tsukubensis NRRL18488]TAI45092.1 XRE family transcriptional regulator [Streptomyces tsukubensis]